jgi:hypothetical protein
VLTLLLLLLLLSFTCLQVAQAQIADPAAIADLLSDDFTYLEPFVGPLKKKVHQFILHAYCTAHLSNEVVLCYTSRGHYISALSYAIHMHSIVLLYSMHVREPTFGVT